ncbi:MAG: hypothetical protein HY271_16425 [Deltaproteobacteria bacterium]|nr:hypothetical protein [Deltaproteobacteria bacterium]
MPSPRRAYLVYRLLAAATAALCFLIGAVFIVAFLDRALFQVFARPLFDTDYSGYYILAFAGSTLVAWGGCLVAAVRDPERASGVGTATAAALILASVLRLLAWYSGEYRLADDQLRLEAGALAIVALGFVWLKPPRGNRA